MTLAELRQSPKRVLGFKNYLGAQHLAKHGTLPKELDVDFATLSDRQLEQYAEIVENAANGRKYQ